MVAIPGSRAPSATRPIQGEGAGTYGAAGDTFDTSRADNLAQLFRDALAELDALEEDGEEGLDASAPPVAENATESRMISAQPVQAETSSETSETNAPERRRNRGRRRKWLAAQAALPDDLCADAPSAI